jgi:hypothetical protein
VRFPFLQNLQEYLHKMIQKCWILGGLYYHLQVQITQTKRVT